MIRTPSSTEHPIVDAVREFVAREVEPAASALEHADEYPHAMVLRMKELGLFGALIPREWGGLGLAVTTYARVIEEICRGFMSLAGVINSHTMAALIVLQHGTDEQRARLLPRFASGQARGGLCLTEPHAGSDVQAIRTVARRQGDHYMISGSKMFVTNGREGNTFALLALTDPDASPRHRGMSCFIVEKGHPGLRVVKSIAKLGYKGVDTAELYFEDFPCPAANLVGGREGRGFKQVMSGLETGRINIAARAVGVARAALDEATRAADADTPPAALADVAVKVEAARLVTYWAAAMKDRGERCDLEAGMAKLHASETAQDAAVAAMAIVGPASQLASGRVERLYRDTPLMIIGEGTNEIQRLVICRNLLDRYGERSGALTAREGEPDERRQIVHAVRQLVDKEIIPTVHEHEAAGRYPAALVARLGDLGVFGALASTDLGGLGLDLTTFVMILEEVARGWATVSALVGLQAIASRILVRFGGRTLSERHVPPMTRGERRISIAPGESVGARGRGDGWVLSGSASLVEGAERADFILVTADRDEGSPCSFLVERDAHRLALSAPHDTLGGRGLESCDLVFDAVQVDGSARLAAGAVEATNALWRLRNAAVAVGIAQAAFDAALRYSQQRSAFGQPIGQHQAIQLKLADMATRITASRLLTYRAAERLDAEASDALGTFMARIDSAETAAEVTLEAMRIHGGYGYTREFPVERFYRDAAWLLTSPRDLAAERRELARRWRRQAANG
ncbi:MAG TPA: acyl-CoA dehydrogenase family protein [Candidatus Methylomirabilis sp.]|nr:acyl-CoA dehydrogenase family protein [Candidatus Methylomirabilis sp.]